MRKRRAKPNYHRRVLRLPDLDHCKSAVLNSLGSPGSRRVYEYAIDQFIAWYCSEPRLAFNRIVVVRYRMYLESRHLAANTINQQLAAVRRLANEAADAGLLSPDLAAGISRVRGVKQLGFRSGNWLSTEQSSQVLKHAWGQTMRAKRDYAMLAMLSFRLCKLEDLYKEAHMPDDPLSLYPDWHPQYQAAMLEPDSSKLQQRILAAHQAIAERMKVLAQDHYGTPEEQQAIVDALNGLAMLERETRQRA